MSNGCPLQIYSLGRLAHQSALRLTADASLRSAVAMHRANESTSNARTSDCSVARRPCGFRLVSTDGRPTRCCRSMVRTTYRSAEVASPLRRRSGFDSTPRSSPRPTRRRSIGSSSCPPATHAVSVPSRLRRARIAGRWFDGGLRRSHHRRCTRQNQAAVWGPAFSRRHVAGVERTTRDEAGRG